MNLLDTLTKEELKYVKYKQYPKDSVIFRESDLCSYLGIIIEGNINIASYLPSGNTILYNSLSASDIFGGNLIFSKKPNYKGDVLATQDCKIALIEKESLIKILEHNKQFLLEFLANQADFAKQLNNKIKLLSLDSPKDRLLFYLYNNGNRIEYKTITGLANELYISRETLSRLLTKLQKQKLIKKENNTLILLRG